MQIVLKKTVELNENEIANICTLFERVFNKKRKPSNFKRKFLLNILQTSYHTLLMNKQNEIVGCYSSIPQQYYYYGKKVIFALSVETMIDKAYRGSPYIFKKLADTTYDKMQVNHYSTESLLLMGKILNHNMIDEKSYNNFKNYKSISVS